jgi:2-oxoglutarate ferredoxin oxidoreductase subunit beta
VTFAARAIYNDVKLLQYVLERAAAHRGTAFVEVYQDCAVYNHEAFNYLTDRQVKDDNMLVLEHGKPMIFGRNRDRGIRWDGLKIQVVQIGRDCSVDDLLVHDEHCESPVLAFQLSRMHYPEFPTPMGIFRDVERPVYEEMMFNQIREATARLGPGDLQKLFAEGDTWTVEP